jgi:hypothetical protein
MTPRSLDSLQLELMRLRDALDMLGGYEQCAGDPVRRIHWEALTGALQIVHEQMKHASPMGWASHQACVVSA